MKWLVGRFYYALCGIKEMLKDCSIALQCFFSVCVFILATIMHCTLQEWFWIVLTVTLIIVGETFNSCIEGCVDYISLERNPRAKRIKDMAAGAMFILFLFSLFVGLNIFVPKIICLLK